MNIDTATLEQALDTRGQSGSRARLSEQID